MDSKTLENDETVIDWFNEIDASIGTRKAYLLSMQKFTDFRKMAPEELFNEANDQIDASSNKSRWEYTKKISAFKQFLKIGGNYEAYEHNRNPENPNIPLRKFQKPLAGTTVETHVAAIRSFYLAFEIYVPEKKGANKKRPKPLNENMQTFEKEKIKWIIENLKSDNTIRDTAIILCGASSGLALSDLLKLRVRHILDVDHNNITTIPFIREDARTKTSIEFHTFFSPEATTWLWKYIADRGLSENYVGNIPNPERYMRYNHKTILHGNRREEWELKHNINCDDDFLFANANVNRIYVYGGIYKKGSIEENYKRYNGTFNERLEKRFRQMSPDALMAIYSRISESMGIESEKGSYNPFRSHNMRKFFINTLENENISSRNLDYMAGRKIPDTKNTYIYGRDLERLRELYTESCPALSILTKTVHITMDEAIKKTKMENEIENLKLRMEIELQPIRYGIEALEKHIETDKSNLKNMKSMLDEIDEEDEELIHTLKETIYSWYEELREKREIFEEIEGNYKSKISQLEEEYEELYGHLK